ncbi:MAG: glycosyltransferase family 2 protein [Candidatus Altiarchaeota archaeon]|nr:glycosyltransferase family 2 protein [Candidatus Altiarchaeota archaeon]
MGDKLELSVVVPVYNEEESIQPLYDELKPVLDKLGKEYEIVFIDDGSTDQSFHELEKLHQRDGRVKVIKFRRNFGQTPAISAGFRNSLGDVIVTLDADLQNDPRDIPRLLDKLGERFDVVSGWRRDRQDPLLTKKIPSRISNNLAKKLTGVDINDFGCTLKAYRRNALEGIELYGETHRYIPALVAWKGFRVGELVVKHHKRMRGETKYNINRLLKGFLDLVNIKFWARYSTRPLHFFGTLGVLMSFLGFLIDAYLVCLKIFENQSIGDRPLLILGVLLIIVGIQFITFGFLSEILTRVYYSNKHVYEIEETLK